MKDKHKRIDRLIEKNAVEQMGKVDWDRLMQETSARLKHAEQAETSTSGYPAFLKTATAIAATAAVVFVAVIFRTHGPSDSQPHEGRFSAVKHLDNRGTASVQIRQPSVGSLVTVHIDPTRREDARCEVEIIDGDASLKKGNNRPAIIIISIPRSVLADNGRSRKQVDLIHLL